MKIHKLVNKIAFPQAFECNNIRFPILKLFSSKGPRYSILSKHLIKMYQSFMIQVTIG